MQKLGSYNDVDRGPANACEDVEKRNYQLVSHMFMEEIAQKVSGKPHILTDFDGMIAEEESRKDHLAQAIGRTEC